MSLLNKIATVASVALVLCGCKDIGFPPVSIPTDSTTSTSLKSATTYAVVVGMENSKFAGSCPGAKYDSNRMYKLLSNYTDNIVLLQDDKATHTAIANAMKNAVDKSELFIFYYSGHGGSQRFYDTGAEEVDGQDEFLCPYDNYMRDNEIWSIISKSKGRVCLVFDCCHSHTMFRLPKITLAKPKMIKLGATRDNAQFSMLCWSGCPDNTYSYGSVLGGMFTNAILKYYDSRKTYDYMWNEVSTEKNLLSSQTPQRTEIGDGFKAKAVFR